MPKHFAVQNREIFSYFTDLSGYLTRTAASTAAGKKLAGAAKNSFMKKCVTDATGS